jgi:monovalent cation:H+ antiporter-2, CPA2 family
VPEAELILTLAGGLSAALVLGYLTHRLGLSPIAGYLLAGVLVGPHTPGIHVNSEFAEQLAEFGILLLMFGVGLQFHVHELLAVRRVAIPGALAGMLGATALGALVALASGWPMNSALVFGLSLSVASTVVLVRVLSDRRQLHTASGHIAVGWLVMEDMLTILVLVLLPTFVSGQLTVATVAIDVLLAVLKIGALVVFAMVVGTRVIPALLDRVAATRSRELFTLTVLVLAIGIAVGAAALFGVSSALGAFVAGMVVGRSEYSLRAANDALPMRDAFAVLFFVSVGMLLNPLALLDELPLFAAALAIVVFAKPLLAALVVALRGYPVHTVLTVPAALAQIGEFSFILVAVGRSLNVLPQDATNIVVAVSIASIVINPLVARLIEPIERAVVRRRTTTMRYASSVVAADDSGETTQSSLSPQDRAVVIGYGPTGRTVTRLLRENGIAPTVVELNMDTVRQLRQDNLSAVYGDARHTDILINAGVRHAGTLIVSGADANAPETIRAARDLNPAIHVMARAAYLRDVPPLHSAGAERVFSGEGEVALAMTEAVLQRLGATADQIDRERARVRTELFR